MSGYTPCPLAVSSSTHLDPPWLRWPEACVCVKVPYARLPIAGGAKHGHAPPSRPSVLGQRGRPRARGSLGVHGHSLPPSGWAARAISAKGLGTGATVYASAEAGFLWSPTPQVPYVACTGSPVPETRLSGAPLKMVFSRAVGWPRVAWGNVRGALGPALAVGSGCLRRGSSSGGYEAA